MALTLVCAADGAVVCTPSGGCDAGLRCVCPGTPPLSASSAPPGVVEDYSSPACRSHRTPLRQLLDATAPRIRGAAVCMASFLFSGGGAAAAAAPPKGVCTCVAVDPPRSGDSYITDDNVKQAVSECLDTNPTDGMCTSGTHGAMPYWDVSRVMSMVGLFQARGDFNGDIGGWDTSSVTAMDYMFSGASAFNRPIEKWDTSSVRSMGSMFSGASSFDRDITGWSTDRLGDSGVGKDGQSSRPSNPVVPSMFYGATAWFARFERFVGAESSEDHMATAGPPSHWRRKSNSSTTPGGA